MTSIFRKTGTVALAAVLLFTALFPVPTGQRILDRGRFSDAEAIAPAIPVIAIFGTALAAYGVYAAGTTTASYDANLQALYDGMENATQYWSSSWAQYVQDKGSFDAAMNSAVTVDGQNISLQTLTDAGFFDSVNQYTAYLVSSDDAVVGSDSLASYGQTMVIGGVEWPSMSVAPAEFAYAASKWGLSWTDIPVIEVSINGDKIYYTYDMNVVGGAGGSNPYIEVQGTYYTTQFFLTGGEPLMYNTRSQSLTTLWKNRMSSEVTYYLNSSYPWPERLGNAAVNSTIAQRALATITQGVHDGLAAYPTTTVQPFEPTAEQLEAGYTTADIIEAIGGATGAISDVLDAIQGLQALVQPAISVVPSINTAAQTLAGVATSAQAGPFPWLQSWWNTLTGYWTGLQAWLGATPFGTVMGTVIDGVAAIPDGIRNVGEDVLEGVGAIPGAVADAADVIVGGLEGVLENVLEGVQAIPASIADVIEGIQSGVLDLTGALDGVLHPNMPQFPSPGGAFVPNKVDWQQKLGEKAPFAYMFAFANMVNASSGYSSNPSFRIQHDFEFLGMTFPVDINAEPYLNSDFGGVTVAQLLRTCVTLTLCMGLLYAAYKTALEAVNR